MRNSTLSFTPGPLERASVMATPPLSQVPTIRLTTATPSDADARLTNRPTTTTILSPKVQADTRRRLVPKKSKLSLLGGSKKEKSKDFSDVARRVGAPSPTMGRSFDIYVDPADDPDIGEIVVLKKKKSRAGLNDVQWGPLGDVTNTGKEQFPGKADEIKKTAPVEASLKGKADEKDKWWTIGRGRKDSKVLPKEKSRTKSRERLKESIKEHPEETVKDTMKQSAKSRGSTPPEQTKDFETRQRSQSFDARMLFNAPSDPFATNCISVPMPDDDDNERTPRRSHIRTNTSPSLYGALPGTVNGIATVTQPSEDKERPKNGSIALRAMRSVRSLARIGGWAQAKNMPTDDDELPAEKSGGKKEKKEKERKKEKPRSRHNSRSSIEALKNTFGSVSRKTADLSGTIRSVSSQATVGSSSSDRTVRGSRRQSGASVASTIRHDNSGSICVEPIIGRASKSSGASTIRWNDQVDGTKERSSCNSETASSEETEKRHGSKKKSPEGRRRPRLSSLFSDLRLDSSGATGRQEKASFPTQATGSGYAEGESETSTTLLDISGVTSLDSPSRRVRPRPLSEQMLGRERPRGIIGDKDTGVIRILDAATTDLACLINRLDLEVTPTSSPVGETPRSKLPERSRFSSLVTVSPAKKAARQRSMDKLLGAVKAFPHRRNCASESVPRSLGQQIAPWAASETEGATIAKTHRLPVIHREKKRTWSPSTLPPAPHDPEPNFHPLPAPSRPSSKESLNQSNSKMRILEVEAPMPSSFATFGKRRSNGSKGSITPTRTKGKRSRGGRGSSVSQNTFIMSTEDDVFADSKTSRARGTLGSVGSQSMSLEFDDPNYDIPGELRILLNRSSDRETSYSESSDRAMVFDRPPSLQTLPPSPGTPPKVPLPPVVPSGPVFRAQLTGELSEFNDDAFIASDDENETKKSFDFTAELGKLDCSAAASNRNSFVMELEDAFRTPRKYSVRDLSSKLGLGIQDAVDVVRLPELPEKYRSVAHEIALPESPPTPDHDIEDSFEDNSLSDSLSSDRIHDEDVCMIQPSQIGLRTVFSKPSQGRLDLNFKFGGNSSNSQEATQSAEQSFSRSETTPPSSHTSRTTRDDSYTSITSVDSGMPKIMPNFLAPLSSHGRPESCSSFASASSGVPITLSDIIPPSSHDSRRHSYCSLSEDESAALHSVFAKAASMSDVSLSAGSEQASIEDRRQIALEKLNTHSRQNSDVSFSGLSTYSEIRRGFEYASSRPTFYPPPLPQPAVDNNSLQVPNVEWRNSVLSLGSVSSYGRVIRAGAQDPFDYAVPGRPISQDISYTVDDTFSFLKYDPMRQRVDSGASSFSVDSRYSHIRPDAYQRRSRRQVESIASVASGPPVSLYNNRGFNAGRAGFTWRQRTTSFESMASGFSAHHLGRPGIGDKMFERDLGVPLEVIAASPSQIDSSMNWQTSYDSVVDGDRDQDSLIDETGRRSLGGSQESLFGDDNRCLRRGPGLQAPQFRPVSVYSLVSQGSPKRDDDSLISMLDGGFVRRRSIRSTLEGSPCARAEKQQMRRRLGRILTRIPSGDDYDYAVEGSPDKARLISRPSFTSAHSLDTTSNYSIEVPRGEARLVTKPSALSNDSCESTSHTVEEVAAQDPNASRLSVFDPHFGGSRMDLAQKGLLERRSLEDCCLSAEGEDQTNTRQSLFVFRRPEPAARKRSTSTGQVTSNSVTPPLSRSRSSSQFTGSQHSIDLDRLNALLSSSTDPIADFEKARLRRRGSGHRRRISEARASRTSSIYETIDEAPELFGGLAKQTVEPTMTHDLSVAEINSVRWASDDVGPALRVIQALQNEVRLAVDASRQQWADTAYSVDVLQSFQPPSDPASWKTLLEHSQKNYVPLPQEFYGCARRPRTMSRPSPYPRTRVFTRPPSDHRSTARTNVPVPEVKITERAPKPLKDVTVNPNISSNNQRQEAHSGHLKPSLSRLRDSKKGLQVKENNVPSQPAPDSRISMISSPRKLAPRPVNRNLGKSPRKGKQNKENVGQSPSTRTETLRFVRPRLRTRPSAIPRALRV